MICGFECFDYRFYFEYVVDLNETLEWVLNGSTGTANNAFYLTGSVPDDGGDDGGGGIVDSMIGLLMRLMVLVIVLH